jgi:hypothetical protein
MVIVEISNFLSFIGSWMMSFFSSFPKYDDREGDSKMVINQAQNMANETTFSIMVGSN